MSPVFLLIQALVVPTTGPATPPSTPQHSVVLTAPLFMPNRPAALAQIDTQQAAIEYSDMYFTRLTIHRYASYAMIPLFLVQFWSGEWMYRHPGQRGTARDLHGPGVAGLTVLFGVNTITGLWNLHDSWHDPYGRTRRLIHSIAMLAADAGFLATGLMTPENERRYQFYNPGATGPAPGLTTHRTLAITSGSVALASYLMMLVWKD